jgi:hypothetical protein
VNLPEKNPCPRAPHTPPSYLLDTFPILEKAPDLAKVLAASWNLCAPCRERHCAIASQYSPLAQQALSVWLMYASIEQHAQGAMPGETAAAVAEAATPAVAEVVSEPTLRALKSLRMDAAVAPDGALAAVCDPARLAEVVDGLTPQEREQVWHDSIAFLTGVLVGEGRARAEERRGR